MTVPIVVPGGTTQIEGELTVPADATGVVAFAHGSGSSRHSPRNRAVARTLQDNRLGTLLLDLLSPGEDRDPRLRFDVRLLATRLLAAMDALAERDETRALPLGLFGASTGAAAALLAAADRPGRVQAVVSRGGRPDLAGPELEKVSSPVLLLVGARDPQVLELNQDALTRLGGPRELHVVPGATHLFEEPGALEEVADRAAEWFRTHLGTG
ncbi:dienelactone hydrolase family protein [Amycolatopsis anabasis]|uniref:dienelactone hydrolase family protein n=1 Tax=Amycolatopsis anabasis TaxID=1840409 RepID=UPI00131B1D1E|nr:alpha/beta fold hydrolase [Amycolatopsis anabasis]